MKRLTGFQKLLHRVGLYQSTVEDHVREVWFEHVFENTVPHIRTGKTLASYELTKEDDGTLKISSSAPGAIFGEVGTYKMEAWHPLEKTGEQMHREIKGLLTKVNKTGDGGVVETIATAGGKRK